MSTTCGRCSKRALMFILEISWSRFLWSAMCCKAIHERMNEAALTGPSHTSSQGGWGEKKAGVLWRSDTCREPSANMIWIMMLWLCDDVHFNKRHGRAQGAFDFHDAWTGPFAKHYKWTEHHTEVLAFHRSVYISSTKCLNVLSVWDEINQYFFFLLSVCQLEQVSRMSTL